MKYGVSIEYNFNEPYEGKKKEKIVTMMKQNNHSTITKIMRNIFLRIVNFSKNKMVLKMK